MHKINLTDPIIKSPTQRMAELRNKVCGSQKRYDAVTVGLLTNWKNAFQGKFTHANLAAYFGRKLKAHEGYIIDHTLYSKLFDYKPSDLDIADLEHHLRKENITLVPLYKKNSDGTALAVFTIIHRHAHVAVELSDELRGILTGKDSNNVNSAFVRAALIVSEELGQIIEKNNAVTKQDIVNSLEMFTGDEVYLVSMNFCMAYRLDPKQLGDLLESNEFKVSYLKQDKGTEETIEAYKFYENMIGLLVSKTDNGINLAQDNLDTIFRVCEVTEEGLPKAVESVAGVQGG